ncbi:MAG: complex I NDUFA9 subunit family protein [Dehalococcoidia bacterium]|nr:complex I NDUFA9 subunit family protein [Dehalococcoidia bacterium]
MADTQTEHRPLPPSVDTPLSLCYASSDGQRGKRAMILVTGAAGFLGRHVVKVLRQAGHPVRALLHSGRAEVVTPYGAEPCYGDVRDIAAVRQAVAGTDAVVHLVSTIREKSGATFQSVNHQGTANVVAAAREAGVRRLVHLSVIGAQDSPRYPYLHSKWQGEQAVVQGGVPYTVLRPSFLFGEGDGFFNLLAGMAKALPLVPIAGPGKAQFQPIWVEDVARCVEQALSSDRLVNQTIEIGGPHQFTYNELMDLVVATLGARRLKVHVPLPFMGLLATIMGVLPRSPVTRQQLAMLAIDDVTGLDSVERHFGFQPRPLRGSLDYVRRLTYLDAVKATLGALPKHIRDH